MLCRTPVPGFSLLAEPDKVDLLVAILKEAAQDVTHIPGWISASIHVSLDRAKVTNYAQCAGKEAWDAVMELIYAVDAAVSSPNLAVDVRTHRQLGRRRLFGRRYPR